MSIPLCPSENLGSLGKGVGTFNSQESLPNHQCWNHYRQGFLTSTGFHPHAEVLSEQGEPRKLQNLKGGERKLSSCLNVIKEPGPGLC